MIKLFTILLRILLYVLILIMIFIGCVVVMYYLAAAFAWIVGQLGPEPFGR